MDASRDFGAERDALKEHVHELRLIVSRIAGGGMLTESREAAGGRHAVSVELHAGEGEPGFVYDSGHYDGNCPSAACAG